MHCHARYLCLVTYALSAFTGCISEFPVVHCHVRYLRLVSSCRLCFEIPLGALPPCSVLRDALLCLGVPLSTVVLSPFAGHAFELLRFDSSVKPCRLRRTALPSLAGCTVEILRDVLLRFSARLPAAGEAVQQTPPPCLRPQSNMAHSVDPTT